MEKRIRFIDIARAFAIIFIVFGHTIVHSQHLGQIFKLIYSFHIVLFFIISGYTFKIKENETFFSFFKRKFLRIMIPYFVWALLFLIPYMLFGGNVGGKIGTNSSFDLKTILVKILYGNGNMNALKQNTSLWFLPALFSMEMIYYFFIKFSNKSRKIDFWILLFTITITYISNSFLKIYLPWGINTALVLGVVFYIGYLFKKYELFGIKRKIFHPISILLFLICGLLAYYFNSSVSWVEYNCGILSLALLSGLCLSITIIYLSFLINRNKLLEYVGKNTMGILIFHKLIIIIFQTKLGIISDLLINSNAFIELLIGILIVILSIICSLICTEITRKICPILIGEKNK